VEAIEIAIIFPTIILALIAAIILPSKKEIEKGEAAKYSGSKSGAVYGISIFVMIMAFAYFIIVYNNSNSLSPIALINGIFFLIVGIGLIAVNRSIINVSKMRAMDLMQQSTPLPVQETAIPEIIPTGYSQPVQPASQTKPQTGSTDDIQVSVRLPISGQTTQRQQHTTTISKKPVKLACPKCKNIIIIDTSQRTGTIQCNYCRFTGKIG